MVTKAVFLRVNQVFVISLLVLAPIPAVAQPTERLTFEVASIKPSSLQGPMAVRTMPGGRLVADAPVKLLIMNAFGLQRSEIVGGPDWLNSERFQIEAKSKGSDRRDELMLMLQALLEERFQMSAHRESRETPAFALVVGKKGAKLAIAKEEACATGGSSVRADQHDVALLECGHMRISASGPAVRMEGNRVTVAELVRVLAVALGRPVVNKTNLSGTFDIKLDYADESPGTTASDPTGPSVFVALQEQLGLKLDATKSNVAFLVIDHIEPPSAN